MIEQNTDRTYWMIGGVIVVGILITSMNISFSDLFELIVEAFIRKIPNF